MTSHNTNNKLYDYNYNNNYYDYTYDYDNNCKNSKIVLERFYQDEIIKLQNKVRELKIAMQNDINQTQNVEPNNIYHPKATKHSRPNRPLTNKSNQEVVAFSTAKSPFHFATTQTLVELHTSTSK